MKRVATAIVVTPRGGVVALSDDGQVFEYGMASENEEARWHPLPDLPQEGYTGNTQMQLANDMMANIPRMVGMAIAGPREPERAATACAFADCGFVGATGLELEIHVVAEHMQGHGA